MQTDLACSLLEALVAKHRYGQPITRDALLRIASYESHRGGAAKEVFEALRDQPFLADRGQRGIMLNHSEFGQLAEYLANTCGWSAFELRVRLKHFEGWDGIDIE
jgi:hypothetical protein